MNTFINKVTVSVEVRGVPANLCEELKFSLQNGIQRGIAHIMINNEGTDEMNVNPIWITSSPMYYILIGGEPLSAVLLNPGRPEITDTDPCLYPSAQAAWRKVRMICDVENEVGFYRNGKQLRVVKAYTLK